MSRKPRSLEVPGVTHGAAPIPMGARVGNLICSSAIMGKDPATDTLPDDPVQQIDFAFKNMVHLLEAGGATLADVVRVTVYLKDDALREQLNAKWNEYFPDPHDRPARHVVPTDLRRGMVIQLEIMAVAGANS